MKFVWSFNRRTGASLVSLGGYDQRPAWFTRWWNRFYREKMGRW